MADVADDLILAVPETVSAGYLVPVSLPAGAAREKARAAVSRRIGDHLRGAVDHLLGTPLVTVISQRSSELPPFPADFQRHLGVAPELIGAFASAPELIAIRAVYHPGWPPLHEFTARASAAALAADLGAPVLDTFVPRLLSAEAALATLPRADQFKLADWVLVFQSAGERGVWSTTSGLGRFGMAELQVRDAPPQLARPLVRVLTGLASRLLGLWLAALREGDRPAFVTVPSEVEISPADVARAYGASPHEGGSARLWLRADPQSDTGGFLTVLPPDDYPASAGEHLAAVCTALFGSAEGEMRWLAPGQEMEQAISCARDSLAAARERLRSDGLPLRTRLMVKYRVPATERREFIWAYVNSWQDPAIALGYSASDAITDERIRSGRPVVIEASSIIDWAIWTESEGITEGAWTNKVALALGERSAGDGPGSVQPITT